MTEPTNDGQPGDQKPNEQKPGDQKPASAKASFYDQLEKFIRREDLIQFFRLTNRGVFIQQDAFESLFSGYQAWQQKVRGEPSEVLSVEKIRKRLIGTEALKLMYLIEGKRCLLGYVLPNSIPNPGSGKGIPNTGTLFDPVSYLDVRDPIFTETDGITLRTGAREGVVIQIRTKRGTLECGTDTIKRFAELCRHSPPLRKEFPETVDSLRGCLAPLRTLLERARPRTGSEPLLLPADLLRGDYRFLEYRTVLVVQQENRILQFFDRKGKGETAFLRTEMAKLGGRDGEQSKVRGFSAAPEKSFHLGKIWVRGMSFLLHPDAFKQYLRMFPRSNPKQKLPARFTVLHVLQQLVPAFIRSQPLDEAGIRKIPMRYRQSGAKYRRFSDWIFVITDKNVVSLCFLLRTRKEPGRKRTGGAAPQSPPNSPPTGLPS